MRSTTGDLHLGQGRSREKWLEEPEDPRKSGWYVHEELVREELGVVVREDVRDLARSCLRIRVAAVPAHALVVLMKDILELLARMKRDAELT